jgi:hypothetical protein
MLYKDYYHKGSVKEKISGRGSQGVWRQDELIDIKLPVIKNYDFDLDLDIDKNSSVGKEPSFKTGLEHGSRGLAVVRSRY